MNLKSFIACFLLLSYFFIAQGQTLKKGEYYFQDIGWKVIAPVGYEVTSEEENKDLMKKGLESIKETTGDDFSKSKIKQLLNCKLNVYNSFLSNYEILPNPANFDINANAKTLQKILIETYNLYR